MFFERENNLFVQYMNYVENEIGIPLQFAEDLQIRYQFIRGKELIESDSNERPTAEKICSLKLNKNLFKDSL